VTPPLLKRTSTTPDSGPLRSNVTSTAVVVTTAGRDTVPTGKVVSAATATAGTANATAVAHGVRMRLMRICFLDLA